MPVYERRKGKSVLNYKAENGRHCGWLPQTAGSRREGLRECTLEKVALGRPLAALVVCTRCCVPGSGNIAIRQEDVFIPKESACPCQAVRNEETQIICSLFLNGSV